MVYNWSSLTCFVALLSFTGGDTAIAISKKAGLIPLQMELRGKDACIVVEDACIVLFSVAFGKRKEESGTGSMKFQLLFLLKHKRGEFFTSFNLCFQ